MNEHDATEVSTGNDDASDAGQTEQALLDAVLSNSKFIENEVPLPLEETSEVDPVDPVDEDPETEEVVSEEVEEEVEELAEEEVAADDSSIPSDIFNADDLDLEAKVSVKIDGQDMDVSFGDLIKGYSTEQSLSKKGRELGEARKQIDDERNTKLGELEQIANASAAILQGTEQAHSKEYHAIEAKIEKARKDGDTFEVGELKDQREQVQKKYWEARQQKEGMLNAVNAQKQKVQQEQWQANIQYFNETIPTLIPDFNAKTSSAIREFALSEGLTASVLDTIVDPVIVKVMNDYRQLKQGITKGTAKRKAIPTKKAVPTKKAAPASKKAADQEKMVKARAFKENATPDDHMDFLRGYASKSLNNIG